MFRSIRSAAAGGLAMMLAGAAQAADMPGLAPPLPAPLPAPPSIWLNSGWYVRGDIGWRFGLIGSVDSPGAFPDPTGNKFGDGLTASAGVGIKSNFLRTDVTFDYAAPVNYKGSVAAPDDTRAKISSMNFLFNGYLDLGTWHRLTPYIGAGAGTALVKVNDYQSAALPPSANHSQWNFAYAGMAGVGWSISPNLMIDVGYRYLNVGNARTGSPGQVTFKNVAGHEVRVGLRWSFDDLREF